MRILLGTLHCKKSTTCASAFDLQKKLNLLEVVYYVCHLNTLHQRPACYCIVYKALLAGTCKSARPITRKSFGPRAYHIHTYQSWLSNTYIMCIMYKWSAHYNITSSTCCLYHVHTYINQVEESQASVASLQQASSATCNVLPTPPLICMFLFSTSSYWCHRVIMHVGWRVVVVYYLSNHKICNYCCIHFNCVAWPPVCMHIPLPHLW